MIDHEWGFGLSAVDEVVQVFHDVIGVADWAGLGRLDAATVVGGKVQKIINFIENFLKSKNNSSDKLTGFFKKEI